jgi:hypothetical protein
VPAKSTVPSPTVRTEVPVGAAKSMPLCWRQLFRIGCMRIAKPLDTRENSTGVAR